MRKSKSGLAGRVAIYLLTILIIVTLVTLHYMTGVYAKYVSVASGSDSARVAKFDVTASGGSYESAFAAELDPTTSYTHTDIVTLTNNSETDVRCTFEVESEQNLPLVYIWTDEEGTSHSSKDGAVVYELDSNGDEMAYTLKIEWDENDTDFIYRRQVESLTIKITATQID